jgi:hypothetical protein
MHSGLQFMIVALCALPLRGYAGEQPIAVDYRVSCAGAPEGNDRHYYGEMRLEGIIRGRATAAGPGYAVRGTVQVQLDSLTLLARGSDQIVFQAGAASGAGPWAWGRAAYGWGQSAKVDLALDQVEIDTIGLASALRKTLDIQLLGTGPGGTTVGFASFFWNTPAIVEHEFLGQCVLRPL